MVGRCARALLIGLIVGGAPVSSTDVARGQGAAPPAAEQSRPVDDPEALVPEWCPYDRRDPRWVYCARLPQDGGQVFRVTVADNTIEALEMVNQALPRDYYLACSRCELRRQVDALLTQAGIPPLRELVADAEQTVARHVEEKRP